MDIKLVHNEMEEDEAEYIYRIKKPLTSEWTIVEIPLQEIIPDGCGYIGTMFIDSKYSKEKRIYVDDIKLKK